MPKRNPSPKPARTGSSPRRRNRVITTATATLHEVLDGLRQTAFPAEWRIGPPASNPPANPPPSSSQPTVSPATALALAEVATCLWYLKTRHFKRDWHNPDTSDDDPRIRRTLGRLSKGLDALRTCGIEIEDPTGKRYAAGSEAMMKPLDFTPTEGLTYERVAETVAPLVYLHGRILQRAEVFVAVPVPQPMTPATPTAASPATSSPADAPSTVAPADKVPVATTDAAPASASPLPDQTTVPLLQPPLPAPATTPDTLP